MSQQRLSNETLREVDEQDIMLLRNVGINIKKCRALSNLGVTDLSEISGLATDVIAGLEEGTDDILFNDLLSLSKALGVSAIDLIEMPPHAQSSGFS